MLIISQEGVEFKSITPFDYFSPKSKKLVNNNILERSKKVKESEKTPYVDNLKQSSMFSIPINQSSYSPQKSTLKFDPSISKTGLYSLPPSSFISRITSTQPLNLLCQTSKTFHFPEEVVVFNNHR
jgi:hypothetical protein